MIQPRLNQSRALALNAEDIRAQLVEMKQRLAVIDEEREILINLVRGYEGLLRINTPKVRRGRPPKGPSQ